MTAKKEKELGAEEVTKVKKSKTAKNSVSAASEEVTKAEKPKKTAKEVSAKNEALNSKDVEVKTPKKLGRKKTEKVEDVEADAKPVKAVSEKRRLKKSDRTSSKAAKEGSARPQKMRKSADSRVGGEPIGNRSADDGTVGIGGNSEIGFDHDLLRALAHQAALGTAGVHAIKANGFPFAADLTVVVGGGAPNFGNHGNGKKLLI